MRKGASRSRRGLLFTSVLGVLAVILACNPNIQQNPNQESGNDGERGRAQAMPLNQPVLDNVSYAENDMTDWKYIQIPAAGTITVTLGCDYSGAGCIARVRDEVGQTMLTLDSQGEVRVQNNMPVRRGNYYVEVFAQAAATDYTIQVDFEPN